MRYALLDSTTNPWSKGARPRARPKFCRGPHDLGQALVQEQSANEAIVEFWKAIALSGHSGAFDSNLAYAYAVSGQKDEATKILAESAATSDTNRSAANIALIYAGLGDNDQAMNWLEKAYDARFNPSILLRPAWDPLRSDARFKNLRRRIGLPQ
jgi:tetratricopeptide (TPR) repeat protein